MKKNFLLIFLLFLTGCSAEYHIDFVDNSFKESISFIDSDKNEYNAIKSGDFAPVPSIINSVENLEEPIKNDNAQYYNIKAKNDNVYLDYLFDVSSFEQSYFANNCYSYFKVFQEDDEIVISTDKNFLCPLGESSLDKVDVVITSNHDVLFNNADEVVDDKYIWHITEDTSNEANIQISFSKEARKSDFDKIMGNYTVRILIVGGLLILFGIVLGIIIRIRYKRVNKI